jgi:predicted Zn-dependent protease
MRRFSFLRSSTSLILSALLLAPAGAFPAPRDKKTTDTKDTNKDSNSDSKKKGSKNDPDDIGDRNVSGKVNFYSLEKEIALGKQLAQQVQQQSKVINDPVVSESGIQTPRFRSP